MNENSYRSSPTAGYLFMTVTCTDSNSALKGCPKEGSGLVTLQISPCSVCWNFPDYSSFEFSQPYILKIFACTIFRRIFNTQSIPKFLVSLFQIFQRSSFIKFFASSTIEFAIYYRYTWNSVSTQTLLNIVNGQFLIYYAYSISASRPFEVCLKINLDKDYCAKVVCETIKLIISAILPQSRSYII